MEIRGSYSPHRLSRLPLLVKVRIVFGFYIRGSFTSTMTQRIRNPMSRCLVRYVERMSEEQVVFQLEMLSWSVYGDIEERHGSVRVLRVPVEN